MDLDARSLLLGAGLFGLIIGVTVGMVAGASYRECTGSVFGGTVCDDYATLRTAAFALTGLSVLVTMVPLVSALRGPRPLRLVWRR